VRGTAHFSSKLRVVDLSIGGAAVESTVPLTVGQAHTLTLRRSGQTATLDVQVRWSRLVRAASKADGGSVSVYRSGLEFPGVLADMARDLLGVLRDADAEAEVADRLFGRFEPDEDTLARLDASCEMDVRRISRGGMLVEVGFFPRLGARLRVEVPIDSGEPLSVPARVAYSRPVRRDEGPMAEVGLQFIDLDQVAEAAIDHWIETLELLQPQA
jgi:Tfp pilus assembly protein PilZ